MKLIIYLFIISQYFSCVNYENLIKEQSDDQVKKTASTSSLSEKSNNYNDLIFLGFENVELFLKDLNKLNGKENLFLIKEIIEKEILTNIEERNDFIATDINLKLDTNHIQISKGVPFSDINVVTRKKKTSFSTSVGSGKQIEGKSEYGVLSFFTKTLRYEKSFYDVSTQIYGIGSNTLTIQIKTILAMENFPPIDIVKRM